MSGDSALESTGFRESLKRVGAVSSVLHRFRRRQQLAEFHKLLTAAAALPAAETNLDRRLAQLRTQRRAPDGRPRVIAFGTREWEEYGFWHAWAEITDFDLWEYRSPYQNPRKADAEYRRSLASRFLSYIDEAEKRAAVHCVFFYASAEHIQLEMLAELRRRGIWTVILSLDDKHQFTRPVDPITSVSLQRRLAPHCDLYWTTWRTAADLVSHDGGNGWYAPEGAHPGFHRPLQLDVDLDMVFIGQAYGPRAKLVDFLRARGLKVATYGAGWPAGFVSFGDTVRLYSRAKIVLGFGGVGHTTEIKHLKGRDFEVPMCGALYLTSFNPELAEHFDIGSEILCYSSPEEAADLALYVLRHPDHADQIRNAALLRSRREHTWQDRLHDLLKLLGMAASVTPATASVS